MTEAELTEIQFPNGMQLFCLPQSRVEVRFVYCEIFEDQTYARYGIEIHDGDCVLDVGANIGMFLVWAMRKRKNLKIYAFEPVPPIFAALQENAARAQSLYPGEVHLFSHGISAKSESDDITFYPQVPANSTCYPEAKQNDREVKVKAIRFSDVWRYDKLGFFALLALYPLRRHLLRFRLWQLYAQEQRFRAEFKPLSTVIDEHGLESVDLLKIDVEGSEFEVLDGIREPHWSLIRQLVVEISPSHSARAKPLAQQLEARGFRHISLETMGRDEYVEGSPLACNVYARR